MQTEYDGIPVKVAGKTKIRSAQEAIQYPPDAAVAPIDTVTVLPSSCTFCKARNIVSDATGDPPGESILNTTPP